MRKEVSTHALWMALVLVLSTTAVEAAGGREVTRQTPNPGVEGPGVESLVVYLWDQMSDAVVGGLELLTGHWVSREVDIEASHSSESAARVPVGGSDPRAAAQEDPTLDIPTSEAGYPQIDPNG